MVVFGVKSRSLPTHGEKTDISLSSADESFEENKSAPATSGRGHSDEHHVTSKFVEAMKNPDWRRRREDNTSSTSTQSGFTAAESNGSKPDMEFARPCSKASSSGHQNLGRFGPWDHIAFSHWKSTHGSSEPDAEPTDISASDVKDKATTQAEQWGLCGLVRQRELSDCRTNGKPMSIIELVPFCAADGSRSLTEEIHDGTFSNIAHIRRIDKESRPLRKTPRKMPRNEQERELAAVLAATEATPPRMHARSSKCQLQSQLRQETLSATQNLENTTHSTLNKSAVTPLGDARPTSVVNSKPSITEDSHDDNPDLKRRHAAFQKMLGKLHKGANQLTKVP